MKSKRKPGFWVLFIFSLFMLIMILLGQTMSFIDYDFTVSLGLQESKDIVGGFVVAFNKGLGIGDTIIYLPLLIFGLYGMWYSKKWGEYAMSGAMAITAYWPVVNISLLYFAKGEKGFFFTNFLFYTILLISIAIIGLWGFLYIYKNREILSNK